MSTTELSLDDNLSRKHGTLIVVLSLASIIFWLLISDGYDPRLGGPASFYYTMNIHHSEWFCHPPEQFFQLPGRPPPDPECSNLTLYTKHAVLLSFMGAVYGLIIRILVVPDPIAWLQRRRKKATAAKEDTKHEPYA